MDLEDTRPRILGEVVGTRPFMAIGVLEAEPHTYRHDLESFLYAFLDTVLSDPNLDERDLSKASTLRDQWAQGDWDESIEIKSRHMKEEYFTTVILSKFPPRFHAMKTIARELRSILFEQIDSNSNHMKLWTGTDSEVERMNAMYDSFIGAFDTWRLRVYDLE